MEFKSYTDAILSALMFNPKADDVIARKQEILDSVFSVENLEPVSMLFVGFNPAILKSTAATIAVTEISDSAQDYLRSQGVKFTYIDIADLASYRKKFQCVVAMDEFFTFADSDAVQQKLIGDICNTATEFVVSTIRDYKNQDFKERDFSQPTQVRNGAEIKLFLESHNWSLKDRNRWSTTVYEIDQPSNATRSYGVFERRTMFFKQLAKFSMDAGAVNFLVHKNLMYKSLIKKNYEHVVSIQFN